jgi:outer membrane lipoprotein-sorting protein
MTDVEHRQNEASDDLLDRATDALRRVLIPQGPPPEVFARAIDADRELHVIVPFKREKQGRGLSRIGRIAAAAAVLVAVGIVASWLSIGGASNLAFATVADVLTRLQSATFDMNVHMTGQANVTMKAKGLFLAPSHQRFEGDPKADRYGDTVVIADYESAKGLVLLPSQKVAVVIDTENIKEQIDNPMACIFESIRSLVREGRSPSGCPVTSIGKKEINGQTVVGFVAHGTMADMTLWADPRTARPVRIELNMPTIKARGVLSNFRYDEKLAPSLFSLEPPAGYSTQTMTVALPSEEGLIETLRTVAENRNGRFPSELGMNREVMAALQPDIDEIATLDAEQGPQAVLATLPIEEKYLQGIFFYTSLKPENDAHYVGGDAKLGTPNRPIFWYRPTGAEKYRVIYADLSVQEMDAAKVKTLPAEARK